VGLTAVRWMRGLVAHTARTVTIHNDDDDDVPHGAASETTSMWVSRVTVGAAFAVTVVALFVFRSRLRAIRNLKVRKRASCAA